MPRARGYERRDVVEAAKELFWENGYEGTALSELEQRTGLNRSSLYLAFGSKKKLFAEALEAYTKEIIDPLLGRLGSGEHGLEAVTTFLSGVKAVILDELGERRRGCLMVNTIAELSTRDDESVRGAAAFRDRLGGAFTRALERAAETGEIDVDSVPRRVRMLTASTIGIWIAARIDLLDAAAMCDEIASEVNDWRVPRQVAGRSSRHTP